MHQPSIGSRTLSLYYVLLLISIGSIEISIATMKKADRLKTEEVYVCGFISNYQLPNKAPWYLDPFLHPLISDIEDAFINGILHTWHIIIACKYLPSKMFVYWVQYKILRILQRKITSSLSLLLRMNKM